MMLNKRLKQKLSEVLPKLQLDLIDDFRRREAVNLPPQASTSEYAPDHPVAGQHNIPRYDEPFGIDELPLDVESTERPDLTMISGKTRDSGYGSMGGTGETGDL
jgi:hypothetical protein